MGPPMTFKHLLIDHGSFSAADLKKCGAYAYAEHPTTEIMLTTYAFDDGQVYCYYATDGSPMPSFVFKCHDAAMKSRIVIG